MWQGRGGGLLLGGGGGREFFGERNVGGLRGTLEASKKCCE